MIIQAITEMIIHIPFNSIIQAITRTIIKAIIEMNIKAIIEMNIKATTEMIIKAIIEMNIKATTEMIIKATTKVIIPETTEMIIHTVTKTGIPPPSLLPTDRSKLARIPPLLAIQPSLITRSLHASLLNPRSNGQLPSNRSFPVPRINPASPSSFSEVQRLPNRLSPSREGNASFYELDNSGYAGLPFIVDTPNRSLNNSQKTQRTNEAIQASSNEENTYLKGKEAVRMVLNYPFYTDLWKNRQVDENGNGVIYEEAIQLCQDTSPDALLHNLIRECVKLKKLCRLLSARVLFLELLCKYCDDKLAWREFIRMEFELGECRNAQFLLQCALDLFPQDLSFKIKQVRVNERLQDEKELLRMVQSVTQKQSSKFSRILMNCLLSLGRLGNQKAIAELERLVFSIPYCMFLETYEFFYYYVNAFSYTFMLSVIMHLIRKKVKKDCFLVYAHEYVEYLFLNMDAADGQTKYAKLYHQLLPSTQKSYQEKGHWEVFLSRMQYRTRIILLIYAKALQEVVHS